MTEAGSPPDSIAAYNRQRWDALARAGSVFNRPYLELDPARARGVLDPEDRLGSVEGKDVLCLASGGGRQSVAFAVLGARVTVLDLSEAVLQRDREAAEHHRVEITIVQGDMRNLSMLNDESFDIVWQPYSITFVPDVRPVFAEVARVLRPGGLYYLQFGNPFTLGLGTRNWNGDGYSLSLPYLDGQCVEYPDEPWVYDSPRTNLAVAPPREYRHSLSTILNGLIDLGFRIDYVTEEPDGDPGAAPGSWEHLSAVAPPWLSVWALQRAESARWC